MRARRESNHSGQRRRMAAPIALFSWIVAGACGSEDGTARPTEAEADAFHEKYCELALRCCAERRGASGNAEFCATNLRTRAPGFEPVAGEACLAKLERVAAEGNCWETGLGPDDPCRNIWNGHYGPGQAGNPCTDDSDCVEPSGGTSVCTAADLCQWQFPGQAGDGPCVGDSITRIDTTIFYGDGTVTEGYLCTDVDGVHCDFATGECVPNGAAGEACEAGKDCLSGYCDGASCADLVAIDGPCSGTRCVEGAYCDFMEADPVCKAQLPEGSPCSGNDECLGGCREGTCDSMNGTERLVLELMCLAGGA